MTDAERMVDLLRYANLSKVAKALGVTKTTTSDWSHGRGVNPLRLRQVEDLLRPQSASMPPPTNAELLKEMRAIRQLMTRQARAVEAQPDFVSLVVDGVRDALGSALAARPVTGSRKPTRGGGRRQKAGAPVEAGK